MLQKSTIKEQSKISNLSATWTFISHLDFNLKVADFKSSTIKDQSG